MCVNLRQYEVLDRFSLPTSKKKQARYYLACLVE